MTRGVTGGRQYAQPLGIALDRAESTGYDCAVFSHATLGTNDPAQARRFYDAVMPLIGHQLLFAFGDTIAYGEATGPKLFVGPPFDGQAARPGNGPHLAFIVSKRALVDAFHAAALAAGGSDEGLPGPRPHYHANYYAAYVRDPDGNKLQAVCHSQP